jgi:arginyl-tRNA synthetase
MCRFSWSRALELRGDTGVYVQHVHARLCSALRKVWPAVLADGTAVQATADDDYANVEIVDDSVLDDQQAAGK